MISLKREATLAIFGLLLFCTCLPLHALTIDLKEPSYIDGVLETTQGGIITGSGIRIQATHIIYRQNPDDPNSFGGTLEAEGELFVEFGEYAFVGKKLVYNFQDSTGIIYDGRTGLDPWFIGGEEIYLHPDGSTTIYRGFATTSENYKMGWQIQAERARIDSHHLLSATNVKFRFINLPVFWMPRLKLNLDSIFDSPFHYTVRAGGSQGPRIGVKYDLLAWNGWKARLQVDYRTKRGLGGGIEIDYVSPSGNEVFKSVNYVANDITRFNQEALTRYRLEGMYSNILDCGRTSILLSYDKLSDKEMATDYDDRGLRLDIAKPTELNIRRQRDSWILNLLARFRVNDFQTVKQELPTLSGQLRPWDIASTGVISENRFEASYLELEYTDDCPNVQNFNSPRYELVQSLYRPYRINWLNITPQVGGVGIFYGNNQQNLERWMTIARFQVDANTDLYHFYGKYKHVITPYTQYKYYTFPTTSPDDHYIFDIDDGWYRINQLRFGLQNNLYTKNCGGCIYRKAYLDIYAYAFMHVQTIKEIVPKGYIKGIYNVTPYLRTTTIGAWDFDRNMLDHINMRLDWTINGNLALATEYRHRSPYDWRKVDRTNFILDSYRDEDELENSPLSDRRDTVLVYAFYRFHPNWALNIQSRNGWNRLNEPSYNEYQFDLLGNFRSAWHFRMSYRHREDDDRFSINFSLRLDRPDPAPCCPIPCLEF